MSSTFKLPAFGLAMAIGLVQITTTAHAGCSTLTGYGQSPVQLTAADQTRSDLLRQARSRFGFSGSFGRLRSKLINYQFACHTSRNSGQTIHHCRANGAMCSSAGLGIGNSPLPQGRFGN
jgi:hypothetical protein